MARIATSVLLAAAVLCVAGVADAVPEGWHSNLKDGLEAGKKSGKPLLVVTGWRDGI